MGAGIVGTAIAARLAAAGLDVVVVDREGPAAGTSSSGEGNLLVSDKLPGPELAVALRGLQLWGQLGARAGERIEFEKKGGLVVAMEEAALRDLWALAAAQQAQGTSVELVAGEDLQRLEPALSRELKGGVAYEQDGQVQPMLAAAFHVSELVAHGGRVVRDVDVVAAERDGNGAISAISTSAGRIAIGQWVVNAAGPWAGELARRLGADIPVTPRRGHVLVTEPLPPVVRRKVFEASYIGSVHQSDTEWTCSSVIEATAGGTMLLGSSRESVGFATEVNYGIVGAIARRSVALVPDLACARLMRAYVGFRPATPDRLPIIGADPDVGRLLHATGHEGAGVGLSEVTAELVQNIVLGETPALDASAFAPGRFARPSSATGSAATGSAATGSVAVGAASGPLVDPVSPAGGGPTDAGPPSAGPPAPPARLPVPASQPIRFRFDDQPLTAQAGATVAGALMSNGERTWRTTRRGDQRRGLFCGIGTCFDCLVDVNGEKAVRACLTVLRDGDDVRSSPALGATGSAGPSTGTTLVPVTGAPVTGAPVTDVVVVGGGPAGMAAAAAAARRGAKVVLVDASARLGGQFFRQPLVDNGVEGSPAGPKLPARFHGLVDHGRVDLRLGRSIWSASRTSTGFVLRLDGEPGSVLRSRAVVLATGASELTLPFPGWELPGVVTAGAAQALLKSQKLAVGRNVLVAGTGPFLLPVAAALADAGARVTAVEAARLRTAPRVLRGLAAHPAKLAEAGGYGWALARHRVRFLTGRAVIRCEGTGRVERAVVARLGPGWSAVKGSEQAVDVDAVCVSYGFVPRLELARQLGAVDAQMSGHLAGEPTTRGPATRGPNTVGRPTGVVACDETMASSTPGLFVAGELAGVAGAEVAELEGEVAGHAAATFVGLGDNRLPAERQRLARRLRAGRAFAGSLEALYPVATEWTSWLEGSTVFCRCEQTNWGSVQSAVTQGATTAREVRSLTRCGMGYCQGRTCGPALQLAVAALTGRAGNQVGDLQKRPVAVPVPLGAVADLPSIAG